MKKVVLASLLAVAGFAPFAPTCFAQAAPAAQGGQIQMAPDEYKAYNDANTAATPAAKAAGFEAYLKQYPNSAVKKDVLQNLVFAYSQSNDTAKVLDAADRLLQLDPSNLRALTFEVYLRRQDADKLTDPAAKQAALDKVAAYAQTGLNATKPADMSQADFDQLKKQSTPIFQSAMADDSIAKKDTAGAITVLKTEIDANEPATHTPGDILGDVGILGQAYYTSTPPDYLNCAWYYTRFLAFAPPAYQAQLLPVATFCYSKYHGSKDGYDKLQAMVKTQLDPPADLATQITPAKKPSDVVADLISTTPDLATLALSDKEFVLQYGKPEDADKVFNTVKGKSVSLPGATVIAATADQLQLAVSDDAVQGKVADFTVAMKAPLTTVPPVGDKVTVEATYASYTQSPLMITMSDGSVVVKKAPAKAPVHRAPVRKR